MASLDLKETWALRETGGRSAHLDPEAKMVPRAQKVVEVPMATLALWGPPGRRASSACQDFRAIQDGRGQRALLDFLDSLVPMERRAAGAHLGSRDLEASEAQRAQGESEAPGASLGSLAPRATLEATALLVPLGSGDPMDPKDPQAFPAPRALLVLQAKMGFQDTQGKGVRRVSKARLVPQDLLAWSGLRVPMEKLAQWGSVDILDPQAPPVNKGSQAWLAKKEPRVTQALPASLGRTAPQGYVASLETEGFLGQWEHLD